MCDQKQNIKTEPDRTKLSIWKDVLALSIGITCNFVPFAGLKNIQSSLHSDPNLGTITMSLTYISAILSIFILPSLMIKKLGLKWTIVACLPFVTLYISSNFYASWYTLAPALTLLGIFAAPLWNAEFSALNAISFQHAHLWNKPGEVINTKFFGIFFMIFHFDEIIGNLLSSYILNAKYDTMQYQTYDNCGVNYCDGPYDISVVGLYNNSITEEPLTRPSLHQIYTLCGVYATLSVLGILVIAIFVHPIQRLHTKTLEMGHLDLFKATFHHILNPKQILLTPLTVFIGLNQSFFASDFSKAFAGCVLGIHNIGFVMMGAGVTDSLFSFLFGIIMKRVHRSIIFIFGTFITVTIYVLMISWQPEPEASWLLYIIASLYGLQNAVWQTHFCGFYGVLFSDNSEVAYRVCQLWLFFGLLIGYFWSTLICIRLKIYIILAMVSTGVLLYGVVELRHTKSNKSTESTLKSIKPRTSLTIL